MGQCKKMDTNGPILDIPLQNCQKIESWWICDSQNGQKSCSEEQMFVTWPILKGKTLSLGKSQSPKIAKFQIFDIFEEQNCNFGQIWDACQF